MEKHYDVIRKILDLKNTGLEGLEHVRLQLSEGKFEEPTQLFLEVVQAFATIEQSLGSLPDEHVQNQMIDLTEKMRTRLDLTVTAYESGERSKVFEIIQFSLLPTYKQWTKKLDGVLQPYILS